MKTLAAHPLHAPAQAPNVAALLLRAADFLVESSLWVTLHIVALGAWISLAVRGAVDGLALAALFVFSFQIYTLDRIMGHAEDCAVHAEKPAPAAFVRRHKPAFRMALVVSAALQLALVAMKPTLLLSIAFSFGSTAFYMVRVPGIGVRLKEVPFFKNVYAPGVLLTFICAFCDIVPSRQSAPVLAMVFLLLQLDIIAFDMKDVENDRRAGLRLISTVLPPRTVYLLLIGSALVGAVVFSVILPAPWSTGAIVALLASALVFLRIAKRLSHRFLFVWGDALLGLPLLATLTIRWLS